MIEGCDGTRGLTVDVSRDSGAAWAAWKWFVVLGAGLIAILLGMLLTAGSASASFELVGRFTGSGNTELRKAPVPGAAVNDTSGDVYIVDTHSHRVERFSSTGGFLGAWGWGVATGASEYQICVVETECHEEGISGSGVGEFMEPGGIAVDQETGDVYVLDAARGSDVVQEFSATGTYISSFGKIGSTAVEEIQQPAVGNNDIAVGKGGDVYITDEGAIHGPRVMVFNSLGEYQSGHDIGVGMLTPALGSVAADSEGDVFTIGNADDCLVDKFESGEIFAWQNNEGCEKQSLAVNPANGDSFFYSHPDNNFVELDAEGSKIGQFSGVSGEEVTFGLAFDPSEVWSAGRPPGVLYAVSFNEFTETNEVLVFSEPQPVPPTVDAESVSGVDNTTAVLKAQVNPNGNDTHYRFQYGSLGPCSSSSSECKEAPVNGEVDLGSAQGDVTASVTLTGLQPGTVYHYRVLATNSGGRTIGLDEAFTTFPTAMSGLPDGRAYELVSPTEKAGGEVFPPEPNGGSCLSSECKPGSDEPPFPMQSAPDGDTVAYEGYPFSTSGDAIGANEYLASRTPNGWQTRDLSLPQEKTGEKQGFEAFSTDLSLEMLFEKAPALSPEAPASIESPHIPYANLYVQESANLAAARPVITSRPPNRAAGNKQGSFEVFFAGASSDFSHILFEANDALTKNAIDGGAQKKDNLYQWVGGQLSLVNVLTSGVTTGPGAVFGSGEELTGSTQGQDYSHAISEDGSRIFWTDQNTGDVYVRENNTTTTLIPDSGRFLTASTEGSKVLLNDGHIYDLESKALTDLTAGGGGFVGILGASNDLSSVYFVDSAVLPGVSENAEGVSAQAGGDNLYLYNGVSPIFIATLSASDGETWFLSADRSASDWASSPSHRTAQVTPDGRYVAFMSLANLTGYDNQPIKPEDCGRESPRSCFEVYEFDADSGRLVCASCDPSGARPVGDANLSLLKPESNIFLPQPRNLADNGRLFFDSLDTLSPQDVNGRAQDVYEYEPGGLGTCSRSEGCIFLISTGHSSSDSNFVNSTPDGSDVFFTTRERLVSQDSDSLLDLYDARVDGGFPEAVVPVPCVGDSCKGLSSVTPVFGASSSATLLGDGNLVAPGPVVKKPLTRAQKLAAALKLCRKKPKKKQRMACEASAKKKYGPVLKAKNPNARKKNRGAGR